MGYHIRITNTGKEMPEENKLIRNKEKLSKHLKTKFNFHEDRDEAGEVYFYDPGDEENVLFYDGEELLAITTSDHLLAVGKGRVVYTFSGCPAFVFRLHDDLAGFAAYQEPCGFAVPCGILDKRQNLPVGSASEIRKV